MFFESGSRDSFLGGFVKKGQEQIEKARKEKEALDKEVPLSKFARKEGFAEVTNPDEPTEALFSQIKPGEFRTISHPKGDVATDVGKTGYVHSILFVSAEGKRMRKVLNNEEHKHGWTTFAAQSLVRALWRNVSPQEASKEPHALDAKLAERGFKENKSPDPQYKALYGGMESGVFVPMGHPQGSVAEDKSKLGRIHHILYKTADGRFFQKDLRVEANKNGWTQDEADAYIKMLLDTAQAGRPKEPQAE